MGSKDSVDVLIIGAGHNGLMAALLLARRGLRVLIVEAKDVIGGACRTERPFRTAPYSHPSTSFPPLRLRRGGKEGIW